MIISPYTPETEPYDFIEVGGRRIHFKQESELITLAASTTGTAYYEVFQDSGINDYQVPVGFNLRILAVRAQFMGGSGSGTFGLLYGDNVSSYSGTVPTNAVYYSSNGASNDSMVVNYQLQTEMPIDFLIPAQKYPHMIWTSGSTVCNVVIYGKLEAV